MNKFVLGLLIIFKISFISVLGQESDEINLIYYSGEGDIKAVYKILEGDVYINCRSKLDKVTPFINAVYEENFEIAKYLLGKGADINAADGKGNTAFMYAVKNNSEEEFLNYLISKGADINIRNNYGESALIYGVKFSNRNILEFLLKRGAYYTALPREKRLIDMYAMKEGGEEFVNFIKSYSINVFIEKKKEPLIEAAKSNNLKIAKYLIEQGEDINMRDEKGIGILSHAVITADIQFIEYILSKGMDINIKDNENKTPLFYAVITERTEVVKYLIENGADINIKDTKDMTPLEFAIEKNNYEILKHLLNYGAKPDNKTVSMLKKNGNKDIYELIKKYN